MDPPKPNQPQIKDVHWQVWNAKVLQQKAIGIDQNTVYFVITPEDFTNLMGTLDGLITYIQIQNNNLNYYQTAIKNFNIDQNTQSKVQPPLVK